MVDAFLIISMTVGLGILLVAALYLLVYYQHPDDHNEAWMPKLVVLLGFVLAGATVLLFPLDVANNEGYAGCAGYDTSFCGGLNVTVMWQILFWLIPIWVFLLIPFMTFYYEADDGLLMAGTAYAPNPIRRSRIGQAVCYQIFVVVIVGVIFAVTYVALSESRIPVQQYTGGRITTVTPYTYTSTGGNFTTNDLQDMTAEDAAYMTTVRNSGSETITLRVSFTTFYGGLMAWLGWFLFAVFGGIGLAALPLDLILTFVRRPRHMDAAEFAEAQLSLRERTNELVDIGELIKIEREEKAASGGTASTASRFSFDSARRKEAADERQAIIGFKQAVFLLEQDVEDFKAVSANYDTYNPLIPYAALVFGACAIIISIFWFIHIIVYIYPDPPLAPFLNNYFKWFDKWFPLFGVLSVAIFVFYLMLCAVKGAFKFGLRFMFFHIHPMRPGKTYMSSFMFNIGLVLLCALPIVQFAQQAFSDYAAFAEIRQIFGVQVEYLQFFTYFWTKNIFIYIFMGISVLTGIYLACRPQDQAASGKDLRDKLKSRRSSTS